MSPRSLSSTPDLAWGRVVRSTPFWVSLVGGGLILLMAWAVSGFLQSLLLEVGAAFAVIGVLVVLEHELVRRSRKEAEDEVNSKLGRYEDTAMSAIPDLADERQIWEQSLLTELRLVSLETEPRFEVIGRHPDAGNVADGRIDAPGVSVIIEMKYRRGADISADVVLSVIERSYKFPEKWLLVSNADLTAQAQEVLGRAANDRMAWVRWTGSEADREMLRTSVRALIDL